VGGAAVTFAADGADVTVTPAVAYFTFASSDTAVATVDPAGLITAVAEGSATITAKLGNVDAGGAVTVTVTAGTPERVVFGDDFAAGVSFQDFGGATNAVTVDTTEFHEGAASLRIEVPAAGYTGGALKLDAPANLSGYDAVSFWAKASADNPVNVLGFGNNAATNFYQAEWNGVGLTGTWTQYIIPIPDAARLTAEDGLFHFAEGPEHGAYTFWLDDIRYVSLGAPTIENARPAIATETASREVGGTFQVNGTSVTYAVNGMDQTISAARGYFTYASSDPTVATVDTSGNGIALAVGTTVITAQLAGVDAAGALTVEVTLPSVPSTAAPTPTVPSGDVISLYSNAYTNVTVDTWSAVWDSADVVDAQIAGDDAKLYTNLAFAGIEFTSAPVDASAMTHFHMDIWTPNSTVFRVKLVDFGTDGAFGGGDDTEHELTFDGASTPALVTGTWMSLEIPFTDFVNLANRGHLAQLIIVGSTSTVYVDNVYFHR
ncbi:MAG: Ig-like domain-containing protein, partial [Myxococcales bacterium]|nr:Ig-like domain-containing protein [Myxococcales bacterium]